MRILIEVLAAVLFVVSSGLLFNQTVRGSRILFVLVGIVALASSYVITKQVLDATIGQRFHRGHVHTTAHAPDTAALQPDMATPATVTDVVLQSVYQSTQGILDKLVRSGTGQATASVSADTVVGTIVGVLLAALGLLSQMASALYRRVFGEA
jgi:hypothetical protein